MKRLGMYKAMVLAATFVVGTAHAAVLFNNGPVVDANGKSILAANATTIGYGVQIDSNNAIADDFNVTAGESWNITSFDLFSYQTGSTGFTFSSVKWSIVKDNANTGAVLASGTTTPTNGGLVGYRVTPTTLNNTTRGIYRLSVDMPDLDLSAGHYWLRWSIDGTLASGPWQPPTSDNRLGNAMQSVSGGNFSAISDPGTLRAADVPFVLNGSVNVPTTNPAPEPGTWSVVLLGLCAVGLTSRRRKSA